MNSKSGVVSVFFALLLLGAMGLGVYYLFDWIVGYLRSLDAQMLFIVLAVFFGLLMLVLLLRWSRQQEMEAQLRIEKRVVYRDFLTAWSIVLQLTGTDRTDAEVDLKLAEHDLLLWGSSSVLRAYSAIQEFQGEPGTQAEILAIEKVIKAIRADVKQQTFDLNNGELSRLLFH